MSKRKNAVSPPTWLPTRAALAVALGCAPNSITRWCREYAGEPDLGRRRANGSWHLPSWRKFIECRRLVSAAVDVEADPTLTSLRRQREAEKLRRERRENESAERNLFTRSEVVEWLSAKGAKLSALLHARLVLEAPVKMAGLSAEQIAARMEPLERELLELFRAPLEK